MIAYVFWHHPRPAIPVLEYESALRAFYESLFMAPPLGLTRAMVFRTAGSPWLVANTQTYEEWYLLEGSSALDVLNEAAVSDARLLPHNRVAAMLLVGLQAYTPFVSANSRLPSQLQLTGCLNPKG